MVKQSTTLLISVFELMKNSTSSDGAYEDTMCYPATKYVYPFLSLPSSPFSLPSPSLFLTQLSPIQEHINLPLPPHHPKYPRHRPKPKLTHQLHLVQHASPGTFHRSLGRVVPYVDLYGAVDREGGEGVGVCG